MRYLNSSIVKTTDVISGTGFRVYCQTHLFLFAMQLFEQIIFVCNVSVIMNPFLFDKARCLTDFSRVSYGCLIGISVVVSSMSNVCLDGDTRVSKLFQA